jgi:hypothetical protein
VQSRWQAWQDEREEKQAAAEFRRAQPAADALDRMPRPTGVGNCPGVPDGNLARTHTICWRGDAGVEPTAVALSKNLRAIGATDVSPRCLRKRFAAAGDWVACELSAQLRGQPLVVSLAPVARTGAASSRFDGVDVSGDIGAPAFLMMEHMGTPLPAPAN